MGVVLVHSGQYIQPDHFLFKLIASKGALGVQLFFVASALTLFLSLSSRSGKENDPIRNFFIRRFFELPQCFIWVYSYIFG